jgi:outer membrane protein insertion porin family
MRRQAARMVCVGLCLVAAETATWAAARPEKPARMGVSGYGFFGNLELNRMLLLLQARGHEVTAYSADAVEDAAALVLSQLIRDGYLKPRVTVTLTLADGEKVTRDWDQGLEPLLPRPLVAERVHFRVVRGVRYYYCRLRISGLQSVPRSTAEPLFVKSGFLLHAKGTRVFTPARLEQSTSQLRDELIRQGFEHAEVHIAKLERDERSGATDVDVAVSEGPRVQVRSVTVQVSESAGLPPASTQTRIPLRPYSRFWVQDFSRGLKNEQAKGGFPDAAVELTELDRRREGASEQVDLLATVRTGPRVLVGHVAFKGNRKTSVGVLKNRVDIKPGDALDPLRVEKGRQRLSHLGVFSEVDVNYVEQTPTVRDVTYTVKEGKTIDTSLLMGYGSYEMLRGGIELDQYNLWGLGHSSRLRALQSFKSSQGNYRYNVPDLVGEEVNLFLDGSALRRQEISFLRQEQNVGLGVERYFEPIHSDIRALYNYQFLHASDVTSGASNQIPNARAAALVFDVTHDRRDNPLVPRGGYKVLANLELASRVLGGDVGYERLQLAASWHRGLGGGRFVHVGVGHGVAATAAGPTGDLPFNKRFFPGGEDSVRGYQQGQAAPRDVQGKIIGAQTYVLGNLELEQLLTPEWSVVGFLDAVGIAPDLHGYPATEGLYSAGVGIRFQTLVGPVRLEYGRVLNPRPLDPSGTFHFSIGFPF